MATTLAVSGSLALRVCVGRGGVGCHIEIYPPVHCSIGEDICKAPTVITGCNNINPHSKYKDKDVARLHPNRGKIHL